jgi:hypothetical protein
MCYEHFRCPMETEKAPTAAIPKQRRQLHLERARDIAYFARRLQDRIRQPSGASAFCAAMTLYREAAYWALTAEHSGSLPATLPEALALCRAETVLAGVGDSSLERVREALARTFAADADLNEAQRVDEVRVLHGFAHRLIDAIKGPSGDASRRRRMLIALVAVMFLIVAGTLLAGHRDLAKGRPWRASSTFGECDLAHGHCAGIPVDIFFHTLQEDSPWVEIDLGKIETFSSVTIQNRGDCCEERAVPLEIEVSTDQKTFTEVAKRQEVFSVWRAKFAPVHARYVRARALGTTYLHLERISVN